MASKEAQKPEEAGGSTVRQNYHPECEKAVNDQIALELEAMYIYISMANFFSRHDQALCGFAEYFSKSVQEELGHVQLLSRYQNKRGGKVVYQDIKKPTKEEWGTGLEAMTCALEMERAGNVALTSLHQLADKHQDYDLTNFLEEHLLHEVVCTIKELGGHITNLQRVKEGHGVYHFDKNIK